MFRVEVAGLPPSLNAMYAGMHWSKRNKMAEEWHGLFRAAFLDAGLPKPLSGPVSMNVTQFFARQMRDCDNAVVSAKLCGDSLVAHGYLPDDSPKWVTHVVLRCEKGKSNRTVIMLI